MGMKKGKGIFRTSYEKTCRVITEKSSLSYAPIKFAVREILRRMPRKTSAAGGYAIGFYASTRLKFNNPKKIKVTKTINKKEVERVIGVTTEVEVYKNSVWKPIVLLL